MLTSEQWDVVEEALMSFALAAANFGFSEDTEKTNATLDAVREARQQPTYVPVEDGHYWGFAVSENGERLTAWDTDGNGKRIDTAVFLDDLRLCRETRP